MRGGAFAAPPHPIGLTGAAECIIRGHCPESNVRSYLFVQHQDSYLALLFSTKYMLHLLFLFSMRCII